MNNLRALLSVIGDMQEGNDRDIIDGLASGVGPPHEKLIESYCTLAGLLFARALSESKSDDLQTAIDSLACFAFHLSESIETGALMEADCGQAN